MGQESTNPRTNFSVDIQSFIEEKLAENTGICIPFIVGDWNETCKGNSSSQKLCDWFWLVDARASINLNHPELNTFRDGSRRIFLSPVTSTFILPWIKSFIYELFKYRLSGDHRGFMLTSMFTNFLFRSMRRTHWVTQGVSWAKTEYQFRFICKPSAIISRKTIFRVKWKNCSRMNPQDTPWQNQ